MAAGLNRRAFSGKCMALYTSHWKYLCMACQKTTLSLDRPVPLRGNVWLENLDNELPVITLTRNPMGRYLNALLAVPVTRTIRGGRNEVPLGSDDGLRYACVANLDQLTLVRLDELEHRLGAVGRRTLDALCDALAFTVACQTGAR